MNDSTLVYAVPGRNVAHVGDVQLKCVRDSWQIIVHVRLAPGFRWIGPPGTVEVTLSRQPGGEAHLGYVVLSEHIESDLVTFRGSGGATYEAKVDDQLHDQWKVVSKPSCAVANGDKKELTLELKIPKVSFRVFDERRRQLVVDASIKLNAAWKNQRTDTTHVTTAAVLQVLRVDEGSTVNIVDITHATQVWEVLRVNSA